MTLRQQFQARAEEGDAGFAVAFALLEVARALRTLEGERITRPSRDHTAKHEHPAVRKDAPPRMSWPEAKQIIHKWSDDAVIERRLRAGYSPKRPGTLAADQWDCLGDGPATTLGAFRSRFEALPKNNSKGHALTEIRYCIDQGFLIARAPDFDADDELIEQDPTQGSGGSKQGRRRGSEPFGPKHDVRSEAVSRTGQDPLARAPEI